MANPNQELGDLKKEVCEFSEKSKKNQENIAALVEENKSLTNERMRESKGRNEVKEWQAEINVFKETNWRVQDEKLQIANKYGLILSRI